MPKSSPVLLLALASLAACATPRDAGAERIWTCAAVHYLPRGTIEGRIVLGHDGQPQGDFAFEWRGQVAARGWIGLRWTGASVIAPPDDARASLTFNAGNPRSFAMRLELRRGAADGPAVLILPWADQVGDRPARWGDVLAAGRDHGFFAVVVNRQGRILGASRVEAEALGEPARAAAILRGTLAPMVADYQRRCQLGPEREERVIVT